MVLINHCYMFYSFSSSELVCLNVTVYFIVVIFVHCKAILKKNLAITLPTKPLEVIYQIRHIFLLSHKMLLKTIFVKYAAVLYQ